MAQVEVRHNDLDYALRRLKRLLQGEGVLQKLRLRTKFPRLSDRKKEKARIAERRRNRKKDRATA